MNEPCVELKLNYFLQDCPDCWQNFIKYILTFNNVESFDFFNSYNATKIYEDEGIVTYRSSAFDIMNNTRSIVFQSHEALTQFKLKWS